MFVNQVNHFLRKGDSFSSTRWLRQEISEFHVLFNSLIKWLVILIYFSSNGWSILGMLNLILYTNLEFVKIVRNTLFWKIRLWSWDFWFRPPYWHFDTTFLSLFGWYLTTTQNAETNCALKVPQQLTMKVRRRPKRPDPDNGICNKWPANKYELIRPFSAHAARHK